MVQVGCFFFALLKRRKQRRGCVVPLLQSRRFARRNASDQRVERLEPGTVRDVYRVRQYRGMAAIDKVFADFPVYVQRPGNIRRIPGVVGYSLYDVHQYAELRVEL